jgi:hypothetical protein
MFPVPWSGFSGHIKTFLEHRSGVGRKARHVLLFFDRSVYRALTGKESNTTTEPQYEEMWQYPRSESLPVDLGLLYDTNVENVQSPLPSTVSPFVFVIVGFQV